MMSIIIINITIIIITDAPLSSFSNDDPLPDHPVRHDHDHDHQQQYLIMMMVLIAVIAIIREAELSLSLQTPEVFVGKSSSSKLC